MAVAEEYQSARSRLLGVCSAALAARVATPTSRAVISVARSGKEVRLPPSWAPGHQLGPYSVVHLTINREALEGLSQIFVSVLALRCALRASSKSSGQPWHPPALRKGKRQGWRAGAHLQFLVVRIHHFAVGSVEFLCSLPSLRTEDLAVIASTAPVQPAESSPLLSTSHPASALSGHLSCSLMLCWFHLPRSRVFAHSIAPLLRSGATAATAAMNPPGAPVAMMTWTLTRPASAPPGPGQGPPKQGARGGPVETGALGPFAAAAAVLKFIVRAAASP